MDILIETIIQFIIIICIFAALTYVGDWAYDKVKSSSNRYLNPAEFLPKDEIHTLKQVFYLILMGLCFINFLYSIIFIGGDVIYFAIFDFILSLFIAVYLDKTSLKNKCLWFLLVPYGVIAFFFGFSFIGYIEYVRVFVFLYFVKFYFDKFMEYTNSNGLGVTIILLFSIIVVSFFVTQVVESKNPLDALVMVSNAFTSNGYAVLGNSVMGKINSLFLVWGGYIISGAGTATLTAALLFRHFNKRFEELERLLEEGDGDD